MVLPPSFYKNTDVLAVAQLLLGKVLVTNINGVETSGMITETEAYAGITDKASHAYGGRRTARTEAMYAVGGTTYVYLCYGIHHLFNVVTNDAELPHAVLIRAIEPISGIGTMLQRRNKPMLSTTLTAGPGALSEALGIKKEHNGLYLGGTVINILDKGNSINNCDIIATTRVGVAYAGADALLPYRFYLSGNAYVSKAKGL